MRRAAAIVLMLVLLLTVVAPPAQACGECVALGFASFVVFTSLVAALAAPRVVYTTPAYYAPAYYAPAHYAPYGHPAAYGPAAPYPVATCGAFAGRGAPDYNGSASRTTATRGRDSLVPTVRETGAEMAQLLRRHPGRSGTREPRS